MGRLLPGLLTLLLLLPVGRASAQATLDSKQKVLVYNAGVAEATKLLEAKETNKAKFVLLAITGLFEQTKRYLTPEQAQQFATLVGTAWPEPITEANLPQIAQTFKQTVDEYHPKLAKLSFDMDLLTPKPNLSFEQWANYVIKAKQGVPEAEACGIEYATKAVSPAVHLSPLAQNTNAWNLCGSLFRILLAETLANDLLKNDILPRSLTKAEEALAGAAGVDKPYALAIVADDADELLGFARYADPANAKAKELGEKVKAVQARADELYAKQVSENRMPGDAYKGPEGDALRKELQAIYQKRNPDAKVLKFAITSSDWVERAEAWSEGDTITSGIFRYVNAAVAVEQDGRCRVIGLVFACSWTGRGNDFGAPFISRVSYSYEVLKQNL